MCPPPVTVLVMDRGWVAAGVTVSAGLVLLVSCSSGSGSAPPPTVPTFATSTAKVAASATPLPTNCDNIAVAADVDRVAGHQLVGSMNQVVGIPEAAIGRVGRIDCYYGIPPGQPVTAGVVQIGVAEYNTAAMAQHRVSVTVNSARDSGATTSQVKVGDSNAVLIAAQQDHELVFARGSTTIVVTALNGVLPQGQEGPSLIQLAQKAITSH